MTTYRVNREATERDEVNQRKYTLHSFDKVEDGELGQGCEYVTIEIAHLKERKKKDSWHDSKYEDKYESSISIPKSVLRYIIGEN